jgi:hypothetical protein
MYDRLSLAALLREAGFTQVSDRPFRQSAIPEIAALEPESRREESVYVEASR